MNVRIFLTAAAVTLSVQSGIAQEQQPPAQQAATTVTTPPPSSEQLRNQVRVFENSLQAAIVNAARTFGSRVREAIPNFNAQLIFVNDPIVTGLPIPDVGLVFHVQIPALSTTDALIMTTLYARQNAPGPGQRIAVSPPAMGTEGPPPSSPVFEPNKEYTDLTREALYDALLDSALSLPVPDGQSLTVFAGELLPTGTNPLAQRSRLLILTIKSEDLLSLRRQQITREQARERIKESRFGG